MEKKIKLMVTISSLHREGIYFNTWNEDISSRVSEDINVLSMESATQIATEYLATRNGLLSQTKARKHVLRRVFFLTEQTVYSNGEGT